MGGNAMREYTVVFGKKLEKVYCNCCQKELKVENQSVREGVLNIDVTWGYFSNKDGETHSFDLCEECYDQWISSFQIPITKKKTIELI